MHCRVSMASCQLPTGSCGYHHAKNTGRGYHRVFLDWLQIFRDLWKSWFPGQGRAGGN